MYKQKCSKFHAFSCDIIIFWMYRFGGVTKNEIDYPIILLYMFFRSAKTHMKLILERVSFFHGVEYDPSL